MLHALRHHWRGFETDDADVTMFIGPSANGEPVEDGVGDDADGVGADRSCSEIGAMLGVSKQAAQRKYAARISA